MLAWQFHGRQHNGFATRNLTVSRLFTSHLRFMAALELDFEGLRALNELMKAFRMAYFCTRMTAFKGLTADHIAFANRGKILGFADLEAVLWMP